MITSNKFKLSLTAEQNLNFLHSCKNWSSTFWSNRCSLINCLGLDCSSNSLLLVGHGCSRGGSKCSKIWLVVSGLWKMLNLASYILDSALFTWGTRHQSRLLGGMHSSWALENLWQNSCCCWEKLPEFPGQCLIHLREDAIQAKRIVQLNCRLLKTAVAELLWWSCRPAGSSTERWVWICLKRSRNWTYGILRLSWDDFDWWGTPVVMCMTTISGVV